MGKFVSGSKSSSMGILYELGDLFSDRWDSSEIHTKAKTVTQWIREWKQDEVSQPRQKKENITSLPCLCASFTFWPFLGFCKTTKAGTPELWMWAVSGLRRNVSLVSDCVSLCVCACTLFACMIEWLEKKETATASISFLWMFPSCMVAHS